MFYVTEVFIHLVHNLTFCLTDIIFSADFASYGIYQIIALTACRPFRIELAIGMIADMTHFFDQWAIFTCLGSFTFGLGCGGFRCANLCIRGSPVPKFQVPFQ